MKNKEVIDLGTSTVVVDDDKVVAWLFDQVLTVEEILSVERYVKSFFILTGPLPFYWDLPISTKKSPDNVFCKKCKNLIPYAEPNQPDGSFICYKCRKGL